MTNGTTSVQIYRGVALVGGVVYGPSSVQHPLPPGRVALDHQSAAYVQQLGGNNPDKLDRITLDGQTVWTRTFAPDFTAPKLTGLDVDDTDHVFVGISQAGQPAGLEILAPDQTRQALLRLGNATTKLVSTHRDAVGNVFNAGHSNGGFTGMANPVGGLDLLITRNPQITFAP